LASLSTAPVINMESAIRHPCQSLADWKTMDELSIPRNGGKFVLSWAMHPKALPLAVPAATAQMAAMRGMETIVLRPEGFELPEASGARPPRRRCRWLGAGDVGSRGSARGAHAITRVLVDSHHGDADLDGLRQGLQVARRHLVGDVARLLLHALSSSAQRRRKRPVLDGPGASC
jgi:hypothetical protein